MYRSITDFTQDWDYERGMTRKLLDLLNDESLNQSVRPGGRTLGRLGWHLVQTLVEMPGEAGIKLEGPGMGDEIPATAAALAEKYSQTAKALSDAITAHWTDAELADEIPMYGDTWKKGSVLPILISHEAHHRGQMTVLMRQAALRVPAIYGPAAVGPTSRSVPPRSANNQALRQRATPSRRTPGLDGHTRTRVEQASPGRDYLALLRPGHVV